MRKVSSKLMALLLAFTMIVSTGIIAGAAPAANANEFSVKVTGNTVAFVKGGATVGSYAAKDTNLTAFTDKDGDLIVRFLSASGKPMWITLGKQANLTVDGKMNSLTLDKSLSKNVSVSIAPTAEAKTLSVRSAGKVEIQGTVTKAFVYSAATVTAASTSRISNITVTSKSAKVEAVKGAKIETARVASKSVLTGSAKPENVSTNVSASTGSSSGSSWGGSGSGSNDFGRFDSSSKSSSKDKSSSTATSSSKPPIVYDPDGKPIVSEDENTSSDSTSSDSTSSDSTSSDSTSSDNTSSDSTSSDNTSSDNTSSDSTSSSSEPTPDKKTVVTIVKSTVTLGTSSDNITLGESGTKLGAIKAKVIEKAIAGASYSNSTADNLTVSDFDIKWQSGKDDNTVITQAGGILAEIVLKADKTSAYELQNPQGNTSVTFTVQITDESTSK